MALILIVDDSPTDVHVMKKALEKSGYQTATAADGAEGVRMAREMTPDLIFMDVVMPGINGYQATRTLANDPKTKTIPIIMVTSKGQETDKIWGLRQGAVDHPGPEHERRARQRRPGCDQHGGEKHQRERKPEQETHMGGADGAELRSEPALGGIAHGLRGRGDDREDDPEPARVGHRASTSAQ